MFRIKLSCVTLFLALFYSPISIILGKLTSGVLGTGLPELVILTLAALWLLQLVSKKHITLPSHHGIDLLMLGWLLYGGVSFVKTMQLSSSPLDSFIILRYFFEIPVFYFVFRASIRDEIEQNVVLGKLMAFLKLAMVYCLVEFIAVNLFGYRLILEHFFSNGSETVRLYDGIFRSLLKPAGPIHGSQNSSLLGLISTFAFAKRYQAQTQWSDLIWAFVSLIVFLVSFSITAGIAGILLFFMLGAPIPIKVPKIVLKLGATFIAASVFLYRKEILAFRDKGTSGIPSTYYSRTEGIVRDNIDRFLHSLTSHPFGVGWPSHFSDRSSLAYRVFDMAPTEVYLFKLAFYLGPFFLLYFLGSLWIILSKLNLAINKSTSDFRFEFAYIVSLTLVVSLAHYESFTRIGFSALFAFCLNIATSLPTSSSAITGHRISSSCNLVSIL